MLFGSTFSGMGGFDAGLEQAGMTCQWQVENNLHCNQVLAKHWPNVRRHEDITAFKPDGSVRPELICGGFPCQDLSVAGRRAGLAGERSGLFFEFMRVVAEWNPKWVLIENVPGLLSSNEGRDMGIVLGSLAELGYGVAYRVLDSQFFGVPQRRRRVFIVGCIGDSRSAAKVLFEPESLPWNNPPSRSTGADIAGTIDAGSSQRRGFRINPGMITPDVAQTLSPSVTGRGDSTGGKNGGYPVNHLVVKDTAGALTANRVGTCGADDGQAQSGHLLAFGGNNTSGPIDQATACRSSGNHQDFESETFIVFDTTQITSKENRSNPGPDSPCHPLAGQQHPPAIASFKESCSGTRLQEVHGTLDANNGSRRMEGIIGSGVRRLTPVECSRLQGFPDDWFDGLDLSDSAKYRMLGNAVTVSVIKWIGERLFSLEL